MTRSNGRKRTGVWCATLLVFCLAGLVGPVRAADDSLKMVPSDCLFCVRINNLDAALGQVDMFLTGVVPMGVSMPVKAQLGQLLGSPDAKGIDLSGSFTVFGPLPGGNPDPTRIGILVPVSDYQQFVSGNPNVSAADAAGISKIGPGDEAILAVTQVGSYALATRPGDDQGLTQAKQALSAGTTGLAGGLGAAELKRANSAAVWAYGNIQLAGKMFGPMIQMQLAAAKDAMQQAQAPGQMTMAPATAVMNMYSTMLDTILKEVKFASLTVEPSASKIGAGVVIAAVPGMGMADVLQGTAAKPQNKLPGYLQNGAAIYFAGSMNAPFWRKINEASIDLLPSLMGGKLSTADIEKLKKLAADSCDALGGPVAGAISIDAKNKPPFEVKYAATLKDPAKFRQILDEASTMIDSGPIAEFYKSMGVKLTLDLQRTVETYKDVAIDAIKVGISLTDANLPQAEMVTAMYGEGMNVQVATADNLLVYALAQDPAPMVHELIDRVKGSGPGQAPSDMQTAMQLIPGADQADFFVTYSIIRIMQMATAFLPIPMPQMNMPSQSAVAIAGNVGDGKMRLDVAVPKQQVMEVMGLVMQMQMQQMQQQQQQQQIQMQQNGGAGQG